MGSCCICLKAPDESDDENSERSSVGGSLSHKKKGYGTIRTESSEPYYGTKETERLVKSGSARPRWPNKPIKRDAAIPKENLPTDAKERGEEVMLETGGKGAEDAGHVKFAPVPPATHQSEDTTTEDKTVSESETADLVSNEENHEKTTNSKRKKKKKGKNISFAVTAKVSKTAGKVKKALAKNNMAKNNKEHIRQKQEERSEEEVSSGKFERGRHERMSSKRMKSKYAREKMEKIEKEREEREKLKQQSGGFRDPRKAAAERGEKLGELEDAAGAMRNQAAGFAETTRQLAMKK